MVVVAGLTERVLELPEVFQVYELAPVTVRIVEAPAQIVAEFTETVGKLFTVIAAVLLLIQPKFEPFTV